MVFCIKCGFEIAIESAKFCPKCGTSSYSNIETHQSSTDSISSKTPKIHQSDHTIWYFIATLFGIIGGLIGYFVVRKQSPKAGTNCLIIGIISSIVGIVIMLILGSF